MDDEADLNKMLEVLRTAKEAKDEDLEFLEFSNSDDSDTSDDDLINTFDYDFEPSESTFSNVYKYNPISSLKPDEIKVIDMCQDPDLKNLLLLNRQKNMQLIQLYKKYKDLLIECKQNIHDKKEVINLYKDSFKDQKVSSGAWKICAPYFKDKEFYMSPSNADTLKKRANNELSYYDLMPLKKWSRNECQRLLGAVKLNYNNNLILELKRKIRLTESEKMGENQLMEYNEMKERVITLGCPENFELPPLESDENINWIRVAEVFLKDKHSDFECRSFWHLFLHPLINKNPWKEEEITKLTELVKRYKLQNWDLIAKKLNTNRTCYIVATYYFMNLHDGIKKGVFTYEEDQKILQLVKNYKIGNYIPWTEIAKHFKDRSRNQLHQRFTYYLSQVDKKKGKFSMAEDVLILITVAKYGLNFRKCSEFLSERSISQIKARYSSNLRGALNKYMWTIEDDIAIMTHVKKGQKNNSVWTELTDILKRSRGQLRQRYTVIDHFLKQNPDKTIEDVPRRKHNYSVGEDTYLIVREVADKFIKADPNNIPTLAEIEEVLNQRDKQDKSLLCNDIDDLLTDYFSEITLEPTISDNAISVIRNDDELKELTDEIEAVLDVLKVDLQIPENLNNIEFGLDLDSVDKSILKELSKRKNMNRERTETKQLLPASLHNTLAMKGLLAHYLDYKNVLNEESTFNDHRGSGNYEIHKILTTKTVYNENLRLYDILHEKEDIFDKRFVSLFKWPAILTLCPPSNFLVSLTESLNSKKMLLCPPKRTYSKRTRDEIGKEDEVPPKRICNESSVQNKTQILNQPLKLTPVTDKSVIVNLLKDKNKKLFYINKIKCGTETKTLIEEITLGSLPRPEAPSTSVDTPSTSTAEVKENQTIEDADLIDLNKLKDFIMKQKSKQ